MTRICKETIVLFDGECIMCNHFIRVLDRTGIQKDTIIRATGSAEKFHQLCGKKIRTETLLTQSKKTIIVSAHKDQTKLLTKSKAIAHLLECSRSKTLKMLGRIINWTPNCLSDPIYDLVSKNRKKFSPSSCSTSKLSWIKIDE